MIIGQKSSLEQGYVYAPYIPMDMTTIIIDRNLIRRKKISKILEKELEDVEHTFFPKQQIMSRYSKKVINSKYYGTVEIKKPTL